MLQLLVYRPLDSFLLPTKRNRSTSDSAHSIPAASTELEATASQDASVVAPNMSTSVFDPEPGSQLKQVCMRCLRRMQVPYLPEYKSHFLSRNLLEIFDMRLDCECEKRG